MANKIDLKQSAGLPLFYSDEELQPQGLTISSVSTIGINEIRQQLLNNELSCPEIFYRKYKDIDKDKIFQLKNLLINVYVLYPNLAGVEYTKTLATRSLRFPRILEVLYGGGTVLLQKYDGPLKNDFIKLTVKKGQKIIVPAGYASVAVNTRQSADFIIMEVSSRIARTRIVLDDRRGMAYYIIRKNAKQEIVRNPEYKIVDEPRTFEMESILSKFGVTAKTPIVKQVMRKYEKFDWLFKENSVTL